ncbi:MAG: DoxX family protein [Chitinophagales bacterium]
MKWLINARAKYIWLALLILRLGIGFSFIYAHGYAKISHPEKWAKYGGNMQLIHLDFAAGFWGFMAAYAEFFGAIFIGIGLFTRVHAGLLAFTMFIAFLTGIPKGEFNSHAFEVGMVFIALLIAGPGKYSLDARFGGFRSA